MLVLLLGRARDVLTTHCRRLAADDLTRLMRVALWALREFVALCDDAPRGDWCTEYRQQLQPSLEALALVALCMQREPLASAALALLQQLARVALFADGRLLADADAHLNALDSAGRAAVAGLTLSRRGSLQHALPRHATSAAAGGGAGDEAAPLFSIFAGRPFDLALATAKARLRGTRDSPVRCARRPCARRLLARSPAPLRSTPPRCATRGS